MGKGPHGRSPQLYDGRANQQVLDAARQSAETRAWVDLPDEPQRA
ncbi:hypothetical protein [Devosia sp.]